MTFDENREKETPLEDIEDGECIKVCEDSEVMFELIFDNEVQQVEQISWSVVGGNSDISSEQTQASTNWPDAGVDAQVSVEIIKGNGEIINATLCIEVKPKPEADFEIAGIDNEFYCEDTDLYFNNLSTTQDGSNIVSSFWDFGNGDFSYEENPVYSYEEPGTYEVKLTVTDECNCTSSYGREINILPPAYQIECPTVTCEDAIETYFLEINPESRIEEVQCDRYNWDVEGGEIVEQENGWVSVLWDDIDESGFGTIYFDQNSCEVECNSVIAARIPVVQKQGTIEGGNTELCEGEQSVFSLPQWPTTDFHWTLVDDQGTAYPDSTILVDQRNEVAVGTQGLESGTYTLQANYTNTLHKCSGTAEIDINVLENIEIASHPDESCVDESVNFSLAGSFSNVEWTITKDGDNVANLTGVSVNYSFTETGIYDITVDADGSCTGTSTIEIFESPSFPGGSEITGDNTICPDQLLTYSVDPAISEGNVLWDVIGGEIVGSDVGPEVSVIFDQGASNYQVSAQLFNPNFNQCLSNVITKDISLFQVDEEIVNVDSGSTGGQTFCASSLSDFELDYLDSDVYNWTFEPAELATVSAGQGTNSPSILFNETFTDQNGNVIDQGEIIVNAKVCGQMQEIDRFDFNVLDSPTLSVNAPSEICAGENFSVDITSDTSLNIQDPNDDVSIVFEDVSVTFNQVTINSSTSYTIDDISLDNIDNVQTIAYNVSVDSQSCNPASATGTIVIEPKPVANISIQSGGNVFCDPQNINTVFESSIQNPNGNETYQWFYSGLPPNNGYSAISGETSPTLNVGVLYDNDNIYNFGSYRLEVTNAAGCTEITNFISIQQSCTGPPPCNTGETLNVSTTWTSCDEVKVEANFSGSPAEVKIKATDSFSNNNSSSLNTQTNPGQVVKYFSVDESGNYQFRTEVIYQNCKLVSYNSVDVRYKAILNTEITCNGNSNYDVVLNNNSTYYNNPNVSATYTITNTDSGQIVPTNTASLSQATATLSPANYEFKLSISETGSPTCEVTEDVDLSLPDASFSIANSSPFCTEEPVVLSPTNPDPDVSYLWEFQGASNTQENITIQMLDDDDADITLTATNPYGCSETFTLDNLEVLVADFDGSIQPDNPLLCQGENVTLIYQPTPLDDNVSSYQWLKDGEDISGATDPTYTANSAGSYSVRLSDADDCVYNELSGVFVNIAAPPSINVEAPSVVCQGDEFNISGTTSPENTEYQISLVDNGQTTVLQAWTSGPEIDYAQTFDDTGDFEFLVEVRDLDTGCETAENLQVSVLDVVDIQLNASLIQCEPYNIKIDVVNPQSNGTYTWSNGMQGSSITVNSGGPYRVNFQANSGCSTTETINIPKSPDEFLWIFPDGCFEYCLSSIRAEPKPYVIGPIPEFYKYQWDFNNTGTFQGGIVNDYELTEYDGMLDLTLYNDFECGITSPVLNLDVLNCDKNCDIKLKIEKVDLNQTGDFINYSLAGSIANNNNFPVSINLTSSNGVFVPSVFSIPANGSVTFGASNPLIFIPDAGFTGGSDSISIIGQNAGETFCLQESVINYPNFQPRAKVKLSASPNPVMQHTQIDYEFTNVDQLKEARIEIYDLLGHQKDRCLVTQSQGKANFDLSAYSSGQYMVVLKYKGEIVAQLRLIKK